MTPPRDAPPRWSTRLLEWVLPPADRRAVTHELEILYRARLEEEGRGAADRWYRAEVRGFVAALLQEGVVDVLDDMREVGMGGLWKEIRHAARALRRSPSTSVLAATVLAIGIAAGTLVFSVVDHVALRGLPYEESERLVALWPEFVISRAEFDIVRRDSDVFEAVGAYLIADGFNLERADGSRRISGASVTPGVLRVLGVEAAVGRVFAEGESEPGASDVALLSHALWLAEYGADPSTVGGTITLDGRRRTVVGVLPAGFDFPVAGLDVLVPVVMDASVVGPFWGNGGYRAIGRLRSGATIQAATAEMARLSEVMSSSNPVWTPDPSYRASGTVAPLRDAIVRDVEATLYLLLAAVGLVLLVSCANAANLMLARGLARERLVAVRVALGASRGRIVREQLLESVLIAAVGCLVALVSAHWLLGVAVDWIPAEIPRADEIRLDMRVAAAGVTMALFAACAAGVVPALKGSSVPPGSVLREGGNRSAGPSRGRRRLSHAMVVTQMAAAVVLITGAGLLLRSFDRLTSVDPGFDLHGVTTARVTLSEASWGNLEERVRFFDAVLEGVGAVSGVARAAVTSHVPFGDGSGLIATRIEDVTPDPNVLPTFRRAMVTPGYFETLGIPLLAGRDFGASDGPSTPLVAIVDEVAAERFWPGENPIGQRISYPWVGAEWIEVVGVVGSVADADLASERLPTYYQPFAQQPVLNADLVVRAEREALDVAPIVRAVVSDVDERVPVSEVGPLSELVAGSLARARWTAALLGAFALVTLFMGAIGVYGVIAYSVRQRTQEIGVRLALGAERSTIRGRVLRDGVWLAVPGGVVGMLLAIPGSRLLEGMLYGISPLDPVTFLSVPLVLVVSGLVAVWVPASRATRIDPLEALRDEG